MQCCLINKILNCPGIFKRLEKCFWIFFNGCVYLIQRRRCKKWQRRQQENRTGKFLFGLGFGDKILGQYWYFYLLQSSEKPVPATHSVTLYWIDIWLHLTFRIISEIWLQWTERDPSTRTGVLMFPTSLFMHFVPHLSGLVPERNNLPSVPVTPALQC